MNEEKILFQEIKSKLDKLGFYLQEKNLDSDPDSDTGCIITVSNPNPIRVGGKVRKYRGLLDSGYQYDSIYVIWDNEKYTGSEFIRLLELKVFW